ncbi:MAG: PHP domain-containing protein [Lachnospiraceae bacterium]|nr:PHP domain-containing protein [Lachnospiraceae bacterium]
MKTPFNLKVDAHVHSINSIHAYSTIAESAAQAAAQGLECIAITDHFGPMFLGVSLWQAYVGIRNINNLPPTIYGVRVLSGVEIDIVSTTGELAYADTYFPFAPNETVAAQLLPACDVVIASYHGFVAPYSSQVNTQMLVGALRHPYVTILGHCDRVHGGFDVEQVVATAKEEHKIIELNCHSLDFGESAVQFIKQLANLCKQYGVWISVDSDAHNAFEVGQFQKMETLLESIDFPEELIATRTLESFLHVLETQANARKAKFAVVLPS